MSRLFGVVLVSVCALATLGIGRPAAAQDIITSYYAPTVSTPIVSSYPVTTAYYAPAPVTSYYAPTVTSYYAPTTAYYAPTTAYYAPTTAYYAPVATPYVAGYAPAATPYVAGYAPAYYYAPRVYVPFQPVRNFFRAL
jgi:hypothetical protein